MITITTTNAVAPMQGVKTLVHGRAGAGKTVLCATAPRPLIISAESGLLSLRHLSIPVVEVKTMKDMADVYAFLVGSAESKNYDTVCPDSISEIAEVLLESEKGKKGDPRAAYGEMQTQMVKLVRAFRDLPMKHVYMSAKQEVVKDGVTGMFMYGPSAPGQKLGPMLPYLFDEVFSLEIALGTDQKPYRYLRTAPSPQFEAKDRSGTLDPYEEPDLTNIFNKILRSK